MPVAEDSAFIGQLLDAYAVDAWRRGVAANALEDGGVPPEMQVGEVDAEGWVEWRVLPSTLTEADVAAVEKQFGVQFPPLFRAYLLARFQLFDQVQSRRYNQQVFMTDTPAGKPLKPLRDLMSSWRPLIDAGFIPFAQWGMAGDQCALTAQSETPMVSVLSFGWTTRRSFRMGQKNAGCARPSYPWCNRSTVRAESF